MRNTKNIILSAALIAVSFTGFAQVGVGTNTPSAALDIVTTGTGSATKAMEVSRLSDGAELFSMHDNGAIFSGGVKKDDLPFFYTINLGAPSGTTGSPDLGLWSGDAERTLVLFNTDNGGGLQIMGKDDNGTIFFNGADGASSYINNVGGAKLGIGTTTPANTLDVNGKVNIRNTTGVSAGSDLVLVADPTTGELKSAGTLTSITGSGIWKLDPTNTATKLDKLSNGTTARAGVTAFVAKDNGFVGIGTENPTSRLEVNGVINVGNASSNGGQGMGLYRGAVGSDNFPYLRFLLSGSSSEIWGRGDMNFKTGDTAGGALANRFVITSTGNVGVATLAPTSKLHVVGLVGYATDAAAGTAGLTKGAFYVTLGHATLPDGVVMSKL